MIILYISSLSTLFLAKSKISPQLNQWEFLIKFYKLQLSF